MTIYRDGNQLEIECEICEVSINYGLSEGDFQEAIADAQLQGWKVRYRQGWEHICPECIKKNLEALKAQIQ